MSDIQPGDVVVCVDDRPPNNIVPERPALRRGYFYRVAKIAPAPETGRLMAGMIGHECGDGRHWCWFVSRFRKLNDTADDAALIARIKGCQPRIPELPRVSTRPVKLDPELWPDLQPQLGKDGE
jgi:hypothetical protein